MIVNARASCVFSLSMVLVVSLAGCGKHGANETGGAGSGGLSGTSGTSGISGTGGTSGTSGSGTSAIANSAAAASAAAGDAAAGARKAAGSAGTVIEDSVITTKLKTALLADTTLEGAHISVETRKGTVMLTGSITRPAQKEHAAQIAQALDGVASVDNKLAVSK